MSRPNTGHASRKYRKMGILSLLNFFLKENSFVSLTMPMNNGMLDGNTMRQVISCQKKKLLSISNIRNYFSSEKQQ